MALAEQEQQLWGRIHSEREQYGIPQAVWLTTRVVLGPAAEPLRRLLRANWLRTLAWAGHSTVCLALIAAVA